jgi:crotonobetainyl-CoA:carnitine CoA-transferase CaiB-like acyl-CoA transferase
VSLLHPHVPNYLASGKTPQLTGNAHPNIAPYDSYCTGTERIFLAVGNDGQFAKLCKQLGADDVLEDPRFVNNGTRLGNRDALKQALETHLARHDGAALAQQLIRAGVPCGAIATVDTVVAHPHTAHRGMLVDIGDDYRGIGSPVKLSRTPATYRSAPPTLGQNTREVLEGLGLDEQVIEKLYATGIVRG